MQWKFGIGCWIPYVNIEADPCSKLTPTVTFSMTCRSNDEAILGGCSERWKYQIEQTSNPIFQLEFCSIWLFHLSAHPHKIVSSLDWYVAGNRRSGFWTWIVGLPDLKQKNKKFMQWKFGIGCWIPYINMIHVQNLLLLLPSVRHANLMMRQFCEGVQRYGKVKLNKLLIQHFN